MQMSIPICKIAKKKRKIMMLVSYFYDAGVI
jgi:hypothetical protein